MHRARAHVLAAVLLGVLGCSPTFDPASHVEKLRVVAIQAEPPEIAPPADPSAAHTALLTSLVLRPDFATDPGRETTVVHVACVPLPGDPAPVPCVVLSQLADPTGVLAAAAGSACAAGGAGGGGHLPIDLGGVEVCRSGVCEPAVVGSVTLPRAAVAAGADVGAAFDALAAGRPEAPELVLGVEAVDLAFALDATPDELVAGAGTACPLGDVVSNLARLWSAREHVLSTKRVAIRGPRAPDAPNLNPAVAAVVVDGQHLPAATPAPTISAGTRWLGRILPPGADALFQPYTKLDAAGVAIEAAREDWVYSWFSNAGELKKLHTRGTDGDEWKVSATGGPAVVAVVARDLRGGTAWALGRVNVQ